MDVTERTERPTEQESDPSGEATVSSETTIESPRATAESPRTAAESSKATAESSKTTAESSNHALRPVAEGIDVPDSVQFVLGVLALLAVVGVLFGVHELLAPETRASLVLVHSDPSTATLWTTHYVHVSRGHLLNNALGFLLAAVPALAVAHRIDSRQVFWTTLVTLVTVVPVPLSVATILWFRHWTALSVGSSLGFSGVVGATVGLLVVLVADGWRTVADAHDSGTQTTSSAETTGTVYAAVAGGLSTVSAVAGAGGAVWLGLDARQLALVAAVAAGLVVVVDTVLADRRAITSDVSWKSRVRGRLLTVTVLAGATAATAVSLRALFPGSPVEGAGFPPGVATHGLGLVLGVAWSSLVVGVLRRLDERSNGADEPGTDADDADGGAVTDDGGTTRPTGVVVVRVWSRYPLHSDERHLLRELDQLVGDRSTRGEWHLRRPARIGQPHRHRSVSVTTQSPSVPPVRPESTVGTPARRMSRGTDPPTPVINSNDGDVAYLCSIHRTGNAKHHCRCSPHNDDPRNTTRSGRRHQRSSPRHGAGAGRNRHTHRVHRHGARGGDRGGCPDQHGRLPPVEVTTDRRGE
jgi:hypothetical protein